MPDTMQRLRLFERNQDFRVCYVFNCDKTCNLDAVETLLSGSKGKLGFDVLVFKHNVSEILLQSSEMYDSIVPDLPMDFAIFVVHASEARLSINEDITGNGCAKIYRTLLKATGNRVVVVITGDSNYKNSAEEQSSVLSRWAYHKVSSQFDEQFLDGRKSFIFSWDKEHRPIHEDAILHFLDAEKNGEIFAPEPKVEPTVPQGDPDQLAMQSRESSETDVKAKIERNSSNIQTQTCERQKTRTRCKQEEDSVQQPLQTDETESGIFKVLSLQREQQNAEEHIDTSKIPNRDPLQTDETQPHIFEFLTPETEEPMDLPEDFVDVILEDAPSTPETLILKTRLRHGRISYDEEYVEQRLVGWAAPQAIANHLLEEWQSTDNVELLVYQENKTGNLHTVVNKNESTKMRRLSDSLKGAPQRISNSPVLLLATRLRRGRISYEEEDVEQRVEGWTVPEKMAEDLLVKRRSTINAGLKVYRENPTGNLRVVVTDDKGTQMRQLSDNLKGALHTVSSYIPLFRPQHPGRELDELDID